MPFNDAALTAHLFPDATQNAGKNVAIRIKALLLRGTIRCRYKTVTPTKTKDSTLDISQFSVLIMRVTQNWHFVFWT
jgi:hypothetical protein